MTPNSPSLSSVYLGWDGYNTSLLRAIAPLTPEQLAFRAAPDLPSVGETARHIALGRLTWFLRMDAPGSAELAAQVPEWHTDPAGNRHAIEESIATDIATLTHWLDASWQMVEKTLTEWTVADLEQTYPHTYQDKTFAVSRQWTIWRILSHDMHHGGQLSTLLYLQGIIPVELGYLGGHLTEPPLAKPEGEA